MPPVVIDLRKTEDSRDVVHRAVQALAEGQLVAFPTETVYGLAASALSAEGIDRLSRAKQRGAEHPFTLAIKSADDALDYVPGMNRLGRRLARRCWPGPVTLVVDDNHSDGLLHQLPQSARAAISPAGSVGLRVPAHQMILDVLRLLVGPVALSSANRAGQPESLTAAEVVAALGDDVHWVLDDGRSRFGQPSSVVRVDDAGLHVLREGVVSERTLRRLSSLMVLFVCTGNTCRSPMAEAICRQLLAERLGCKASEVEDRGVILMSAGIAAMAGGRPTAEAMAAMSKQGLSLTEHESQPVTDQLMRHADVVLTMTRSHRDALLTQWPDAGDRVHLLCRTGGDVDDPIGGPPDLYERCAAQIRAELKPWVDQLEI